MDHLPVFLQLQARPAVVVGGGHVAARKVELLLRSGAHVTLVAPELLDGLRKLADQGRIQHVCAEFADSHLDEADIVVAATSEREVNAQVSASARRRRIPVNVVDDPELSTFIFPAIIDRSPIVVAVSSGGHAPVLARRLREQLEALLPARLGALARFMGERRKAVQNALRFGARRPFWERIVGGLVGSRVMAGDDAGAQSAFERELYESHLTSNAAKDGRGLGEVYLIGAGPGDPDLLTLRALQLLQQADIVLYDRLVPDAVLDRARRDARRVFVGKDTPTGRDGRPPGLPRPGDERSSTPGQAARVGCHTVQERINELLVQYAKEGLRVARLKGGDPFIFGRGGEEIEVLSAHSIPYIVVPGITAALGAASSATLPLTHRKLAQSVTFVTGHVLDDGTLDWQQLAGPHRTVVFYMGVAHLSQIAARLRAAGAPADRPVAIIERATLPEQRVLRGSLDDIVSLAASSQVTAPALLVVGDVAAFATSEVLVSTVAAARLPAADGALV
ncbi:MAG TPA: uroporphyrinogen-III C-methyltransferase [Steroidobacteraceae bacterium]|jgi:uroporphyrin-III C-methyltransferase/precorrin-2 dehydrogenase/sirohydrochlorin ferrochelatase